MGLDDRFKMLDHGGIIAQCGAQAGYLAARGQQPVRIASHQTTAAKFCRIQFGAKGFFVHAHSLRQVG